MRIGIDLGGTKIAGLALARTAETAKPYRISTPRHDYDATICAVVDLVAQLVSEHALNESSSITVGVGMPGSIAPGLGAVQNANSVWLNGRPFDRDLAAALRWPVRVANDADCFALSEATDGAGEGARSVFGVILGTGVGGGLVYDGRLITGPRGTGGEWGHNPLPWANDAEVPGPQCWCGRRGCLEAWVSGPGLAADHARACGQRIAVEDIVKAASAGVAAAQASLDRHADRLARGLAHVANIFDPDVIVLGGGLSNLDTLYEAVPTLIKPHLFSDCPQIDLRRPRWGDDSGVRGAARLWP